VAAGRSDPLVLLATVLRRLDTLSRRGRIRADGGRVAREYESSVGAPASPRDAKAIPAP
jgi:hypothetical protein